VLGDRAGQVYLLAKEETMSQEKGLPDLNKTKITSSFSVTRVQESMKQLFKMCTACLRQYPERLVLGAFLLGALSIWNPWIFLVVIFAVCIGFHLYSLRQEQNAVATKEPKSEDVKHSDDVKNFESDTPAEH